MKILIVDDEVIVAKALSRAFVASGHEVSMAHTGDTGLAEWYRYAPDVVFLDVVMPELTGPQVIQEYRTKNPKNSKKQIIILMTAHSSVKHRESALEVGADDFIRKPFDNVFDIVKKAEMLFKELK